VTATETGIMYTWPLPRPVADDPDRMEVWLQAVAGVKPKGTATVLLDVKTWEERRQELRSRWPEADPALTPSPSPPRREGLGVRGAAGDVAWHDARARAAEEDGNTTAVLWHLDRLTALQPGNWHLHARRGRAYSEAGDFARAAEAYDQAPAQGGSQALADWYRHRAVGSTGLREWSQELWYLDRLVAACPDDQQAYVDRALTYHQLGKEAERDADLARAVEKGALDAQVCYRHALACLKAGNRPGYQRVCVRLLQALPADPSQVEPGLANNVAMMCALGPDAVPDWKQPLALIEHALGVLDRIKVPPGDEETLARFNKTRHALLNTHGAVLYRAGRYREAVDRLHKALEIHGQEGVFHDWVFLALAHHRLGQAREAREWLARALRDRPREGAGLSWDALEKRLLCTEAEAMIQRGSPPGQ
jgi:tetratricopeptide (TPR) repeat protein